MYILIGELNGQKIVIPLTADAGAGNPVGSLISMYKKSSPSGYLYCDGSTFDQTQYPLLYAYLGSNVLPDYREFALVGAEENTTDVYNASTNPNGTIHDHDVYTEGQAKDDQLQEHTHKYTITADSWSGTQGSSTRNLYTQTTGITQGVNGARVGTVTRGKRKAVYFYIKATSGLSENAQDNVVAQLNEERSYSTDEVNTGKKWIDGKPIYRKVVTKNESSAGTHSYDITSIINVVNEFVGFRVLQSQSNSTQEYFVEGNYYNSYNTYSSYIDLKEKKIYYSTTFSANTTLYFILEYTKTT